MEIEVGEFVRTNNKGNIGQVIDIFQGHCVAKYHIEFKGNVKVKRQYLSTNTIAKHSKNIIDLVETGDLIKTNEEKTIIHIYDIDVLEAVKEDIEEGHFKIESIVTHEQFASIEYKVEEDK